MATATPNATAPKAAPPAGTQTTHKLTKGRAAGQTVTYTAFASVAEAKAALGEASTLKLINRASRNNAIQKMNNKGRKQINPFQKALGASKKELTAFLSANKDNPDVQAKIRALLGVDGGADGASA